jgi:hypothetical protein
MVNVSEYINFKVILKSAIPFIVGLLLGSMWSKNKYVWIVLVGYLISTFVLSLLATSISNIKQSTDKLKAVKQESLASYKAYSESVFDGHKLGDKIFNKWYGLLSFYVGLSIIGVVIIQLIKGNWFFAYISLLGMFMFITLNQIYKRRD